MKKFSTQRLLEIFPGLMTWMTFLLPIPLSIFAPVAISIALLVFSIYWLLKAFVLSYHLIKGYKRFRHDIKINWLEKCKKAFPDKYNSIYHMTVVATYKEELETLRQTMEALQRSDYPLKKIIVVLATESRDIENGLSNAQILEKEYGHIFHKFYYTVHTLQPGETPGKGSNISYSAKEALRDIIKKDQIPTKNVIVTSLDADHQVDKKYFACVSYNFLSTDDPDHKSFQPIPLFFNNIWQTPFPMRLISMGSSFWQIVEATRPHRLRNFAAHSQSLNGLIQTDFWSITSIVEDGHQFWRSYFAFNGNHKVIPIFIPIYQDAVLAGDLKKTIKEQYYQKRRWAYGCSDIPFAITQSIKHKEIPFLDKWMQVYRLIEGHYTWATTSIVLAVVGWLPIILNNEYSSTVLAWNFPYYYKFILYCAMSGMIITISISALLIPTPHKSRRKTAKRMLWDWILTPIFTPITNILFGSIPAIDSQTRLMIGKYFGEFRVTIKKPVIKQNERIT